MTNDMAYGYIRASTDEQATTLKAQQTVILQAYDYKLKANGYDMANIFIDKGVSGSIPLGNRQAGHQLLMTLKPGDAVIMKHVDRGWRSMVDCVNTLERWNEQNIRVIFVDFDVDTRSPMGSFALKLFALCAEFERAMVRERMKAFQAQRRREGRPINQKAPYGYKVVGQKGNRRFEPDAALRTIGARFLDWHLRGWTYPQIVKHCEENGIVLPHTGRPPVLSVVFTMVKKEAALQAEERNKKRDVRIVETQEEREGD